MKFICVTCKGDKFLEGPHGGLAVNFCCASCFRRYNDLGPFGIARDGFVEPEARQLFNRGDWVPRSKKLISDGVGLPTRTEDLIPWARDAVQQGAGHDCDEWPTPEGVCALCGRYTR